MLYSGIVKTGHILKSCSDPTGFSIHRPDLLQVIILQPQSAESLHFIHSKHATRASINH